MFKIVRHAVLVVLVFLVGLEWGAIGYRAWLRDHEVSAPVRIPVRVSYDGKDFPIEAWSMPELPGKGSFVETIASSVAKVNAHTPGNPAGEFWAGTGVAISANMLLTAEHVVRGASAVTVAPCKRVSELDPLICAGDLRATVVAASEDNDVALLLLNATSVFGPVPAEIGDVETLVPGEWLWRAGLDGVMVAGGFLISVSHDTFEITAPGHPGASGGPVFDRTGRVVGIMTSYGTEMLSVRGRLLSVAVLEDLYSKYSLTTL